MVNLVRMEEESTGRKDEKGRKKEGEDGACSSMPGVG